ncbi:sugar phosphate isomerase/epimerase family protein [Agromyces bauzanensis]
MPDLGIDHLTALDLTPDEFVRAAGEAGFASVSLRTIHVVGGEPSWAGTPIDTASLGREIADAGMRVHAIEAVAITPDLGNEIDPLRPLLQQGAELGADLLYSFSDDPDAARCADTFARLAVVAAESGLRLVLEPMPYRSVATLAQAAGIVASAPGAGLIVDTLHASRGGAAPADLAGLAPELLAVLQLCDAPAAPPTAPSPSGLHPLLHEARFDRRLPGAGALPLLDFAAAMPDGALVTVEAPAPTGDAAPARRLERVLSATLAALGRPLDEGSAR